MCLFCLGVANKWIHIIVYIDVLYCKHGKCLFYFHFQCSIWIYYSLLSFNESIEYACRHNCMAIELNFNCIRSSVVGDNFTKTKTVQIGKSYHFNHILHIIHRLKAHTVIYYNRCTCIYMYSNFRFADIHINLNDQSYS